MDYDADPQPRSLEYEAASDRSRLYHHMLVPDADCLLMTVGSTSFLLVEDVQDPNVQRKLLRWSYA
jgi:hypothetical protein